MYKIVVADDEPLIIRGLKKLVDWERINSEIIGEAENGRKLMELIEDVHPDIIISDIAMPQATGLDVIREIREKNINAQVIFMSGYQEFSYAKAAIQYGAVDYLLKPVSEEELRDSVMKAQEILRKDQPDSMWEEENDIESAFKTIASDHETVDFYERFKEMGIDTEGKVFQGVCFALTQETVDSIPDKNRLKLLRFNLFKKIQEYLRKERLGFSVKQDGTSCKMMVVLSAEKPEQEMDQILKQVGKMAMDTYKVKIAAGIGKEVGSIKELKFAYKTARFALGLRYFEPSDIIRYKEIAGREFHYSFEDYKTSYQEFLQSVLNREEAWDEKFRECLRLIENLHYGNRYAAENRCVVLAMDLFGDLEDYHMVDSSLRGEYENWINNLRQQNTFQELKEVFLCYYKKFIPEVFKQQTATDKSVIYQVKEYIREHYAEDLSLGVLAGRFYMNQYYFSTFFKKETGQNYKNYVTEVRMKQAMKILMESEDIKTSELAQAVGYKDVRSFTDKFKEVYGESPAGYKKKKR